MDKKRKKAGLTRAEKIKQSWSDPLVRQRRIEAIRLAKARRKVEDPGGWAAERKAQALAVKKNWKTNREALVLAIHSPAADNKRRKALAKTWNTEKRQQAAERTSITNRKWWSNPKLKRKMLKVRQEQGKRPETKKKLSDRMKKLWADPAWKAKMSKIRKTQSKGNQVRTPNASFYRTMYDGVNGKFWMRSGWEVAFAGWLDNSGICWKYESKRFCLGKGRYYTPDFYLVDQDTHVELKGWLSEKDKQKIALFQKLYPDVKFYLFFGEHLRRAKIIQFPTRKAA